MTLMTEIADAVKNLRWVYKANKRQDRLSGFPDRVKWDRLDKWPMRDELRELLARGKDTREHIRGVVASINDLISGKFRLIKCGDEDIDADVEEHLKELRRFCLKRKNHRNRNSILQSEDALEFAKHFLRVAALYHDTGKIIGSDRHVSRGVHLMRDVNDEDRVAFEQELMEGGFENKHNFWTLLLHHDIFGCLCTGEASLPALSPMVSWSGDQNVIETHRSPVALVSYLLLVNLADVDSSLCFSPYTALTGLRTVEAGRYFEDWRTVTDLLWDAENTRPKEVSREGFRDSLLSWSGHPERTIKRITRLITSCYRMQVADDLLLDESEVRKMVEDELDMLHGARLQMFCYLFARFCKIDYGLRFFNAIMLFELVDEQHGLLEHEEDRPEYEFPDKPPAINGLREDDRTKRRSACLKEMTCRTCSILKRIVDDYGDSVAGDPRSAPLMCIVMANLMPEFKSKTAWAICRALKDHESRALAWISEEVAVSPYGG